MEELNIIIEPELEFTLKKCGEVVPYGITPEERAKLAGIEENANDYTHPETHPASILDVVDVVNGAANKFLNERGEIVAVAHESLTDKNSEADFQHIDTTITKPALDAADMVAIKDGVTGKMVLTPKSNFNADNLIAEYVHSGNKEVAVTAVDIPTSTFAAQNHGLTNGTQVFYALNLNVDLSLKWADYFTGGVLENWNNGLFIINSTSNTFQLSKTTGGAPIVLTNKATADLTKWHFEVVSTSNLNISGFDSKRIRVEIYLRKGGLVGGAYGFNNTPGTKWYSFGLNNNYSNIQASSSAPCFGYNELIAFVDNGISVIYSQNFRNLHANSEINTRTFWKLAAKDITSITILNCTFLYPLNGCVIKIYKI